jgi:hypothetical protein
MNLMIVMEQKYRGLCPFEEEPNSWNVEQICYKVTQINPKQ